MVKNNVKSNSETNNKTGKAVASSKVIRFGDSKANMAIASTPKTSPPPKKVNK